MAAAPAPSSSRPPASSSGLPKGAWAWALYDWGNSAFATTVMAGLFPVAFKGYWSKGVSPAASTAALGFAAGGASLLVALLSPWLGAQADRGGKLKTGLFALTLLGAFGTMGLALVPEGAWPWAAACYVIGTIGFFLSLVYYDSLLMVVAPENQRHLVSGLGYSLGYLGGGLLFAVHVAMALKPAWFGLPDAMTATKVAFVTVGLWWLAFTIPLMLRVPDGHPSHQDEGLADRMIDLLRSLRKRPSLAMFLVGYFLYIDGVHTVIRMAVDFGLNLGLPASALVLSLLITQFVGFPSAWGFGKAAERWGARPLLVTGVITYICVTLFATQLRHSWQFFLMSVVIGLVQGGVQALSRSEFSKYLAEDESAAYFGLFNMVGKFAAVVGPLLVGAVALLSGSTQFSILSLLILFGGGLALLLKAAPPPSHHP